MNNENEKYRKIVEMLGKSRPLLDQPGKIENEIISRIEKKTSGKWIDLTDALFSWVYIPWIRRILAAASFATILVFFFQQSILIKQINNINKQVIVLQNDFKTGNYNDVSSGHMKLYEMSGGIHSGRKISINEKDLERLVNSYYDLDGRYKDLLRIIDENPELRKYVEKKLNEKEITKPEL